MAPEEEVEEINLFYDFYGELDEEDYDWLSLHDLPAAYRAYRPSAYEAQVALRGSAGRGREAAAVRDGVLIPGPLRRYTPLTIRL